MVSWTISELFRGKSVYWLRWCTEEIPSSDPLAFSELFLTDELAEKTVTETNQYAEQYNLKKQLKNGSKDKRWKPQTISELKLQVQRIMYRGVVWKPSYSHYYTTKATYSTSMISRILLYNRLELIERYIQFCW